MKIFTKAITFALIFTAISIFAGDASAQGVQNEILRRMDAHNKAMTSLKADIKRVQENHQIGTTETNSGTLTYLPGKNQRSPYVRLDWKSPEEIMTVANKQYMIYRPRLKQAYTGSTDKASKNANAAPALSFMNMSSKELRANFDVAILSENATLSSGTNTIQMKLTPKKSSSYSHAEVWVDSDGMPLQVKILEKNNDSTTILLTNLKRNGQINTSEFVYRLPKGTEILKS
ncbi:MAG: outer membrane lipoprotein carrier protein LolA [Acidobacteria bacterium]|nr:outer membrane lipoprotein carrier protein LolA [Acidobacteriota bacterium]